MSRNDKSDLLVNEWVQFTAPTKPYFNQGMALICNVMHPNSPGECASTQAQNTVFTTVVVPLMLPCAVRTRREGSHMLANQGAPRLPRAFTWPDNILGHVMCT